MAVITHLPTAAAAPVINPSRRGRFPRGITSIRKGIWLRANRLAKSTLATDAQHDIAGWDRIIAIAQQKRAIAQSTLVNFANTNGATR